ncbi:MAG: metal ABC transporter ATP-binding protein [Chlamydiota bacterium]
MTISFEQVCFSHKTRPVLHNVSTRIAQGRLVGIIGPNGGGKTTFLDLCTGDLTPEKGIVQVETTRPYAIGFVSQGGRYDRQFPITVWDVLLSAFVARSRFWGRLPEDCLKQAEQCLVDLELTPYRNVSFGNLSTGLMQKVLIGRALLDNPEILLLDEPTSNLDPDARAKLLELIYSLKGKMTILLVTHDLEIAIHHVDQVLYIERTLSSFKPQDICKHFGIGLYHHAPLNSGAS